MQLVLDDLLPYMGTDSEMAHREDREDSMRLAPSFVGLTIAILILLTITGMIDYQLLEAGLLP